MTISPDELARLRADTPACQSKIFLGHAGASLMPRPVVDGVGAYLRAEIEDGGYNAAAQFASALEQFYTHISKLIGANADEIAFVDNASRAFAFGVGALNWRAGDRILVHQREYAANLMTLLHMKEQFGIEIDYVGSSHTGQIDLDELEKKITTQTKMIAITHVPMHLGAAAPIIQIGALAARYGLIFCVDASQSVGQIDLDVKKIGCQILVGTGRKFMRAPRGTGFLYMSNGLSDRARPMLIDWRAASLTGPQSFEWSKDARRFETWERNFAGQYGLGIAAQYATDIGVAHIEARIKALTARLIRKLDEIDRLRLVGSKDDRAGIVSFLSTAKPAAAIVDALKERGVFAGLLSGPQIGWEVGDDQTQDAVRFGVHYFNTEQEIDRAADHLTHIFNTI